MPIDHGGIADEVFERCPFRLPGITSRLVNGRSAAELPISRHSSTQAIAAERSSGCDRKLASISMGSSGLGPVRRRWPRLLGRTTPPCNVHPLAGRPNLALFSALDSGTSAWHVCTSGVSSPEELVQKKVASPMLLRGGRAS